MKPIPRTLSFVLLAIAGLLAGGARADDAAGGRAIDEEHPGYPYYRQYCASCHGVFADGKGLVAPFLKDRVPDLTHLEDPFGSPLPEARLAEFIEGANMPRAHGSTEMPVWGRVLRETLPAGLGNLSGRRAMIALIVDYLVAIQKGPKPLVPPTP